MFHHVIEALVINVSLLLAVFSESHTNDSMGVLPFPKGLRMTISKQLLVTRCLSNYTISKFQPSGIQYDIYFNIIIE